MVLVFDVDRSLSAIGGYAEAERLFGVPPIPVSGGLSQILQVLRGLVRKEVVEERHPLMPEPIQTERLVLNEQAQKLGLKAIVIDTLSIAAEQERELIMKERNLSVMDLQGWGIFGDRAMRFLRILSMFPLTVICTVHIDRARDDLGAMVDAPAVKGSAKYDSARLFDLILYGIVQRGKDGTTWMWRTRPDGRRVLAKDRLGVLPETVPQDYRQVLPPYLERGIAPKILIVADSGGGKTYSLRTLPEAFTTL